MEASLIQASNLDGPFARSTNGLHRQRQIHMDIRWTAPSLAYQIPSDIANACSAKRGAPVNTDEEVLGHAWCRQKIAA
jgi:ribose 1,5-bisphosphokinase PhnN